jgi:hypothetical protein
VRYVASSAAEVGRGEPQRCHGVGQFVDLLLAHLPAGPGRGHGLAVRFQGGRVVPINFHR